MSYCTPAQLLQNYDSRVIGDCVSDSGVRVSAAALLSDAIVAAHLDQASGEIDAALMQGGRYSASDLANLTGNALAFRTALCANLAFASLWSRQTKMNEGDDRGDKVRQSAQAELERLR